MDTDLNPSALLAEMAQLAADIARAWAPVAELQARQTEQGTLDPEARDAAKTFNSVNRTLRQTLALYTKLQQPSAPAHPVRDRSELRRQVERVIAHHPEPGERENLLADFHERLDCKDFERDFATIPLVNAIEIICRDLGLHLTPCAPPAAPDTTQSNITQSNATQSNADHAAQAELPWQTLRDDQARARTKSGSDPPTPCIG